MKNDISSHTIEIPCPHCAQKISKTVIQLKTLDHLTCPRCSSVIHLDKAHMRREIAKLQSAVDTLVDKTTAELRRALGRLGK